MALAIMLVTLYDYVQWPVVAILVAEWVQLIFYNIPSTTNSKYLLFFSTAKYDNKTTFA